MNHLKGGLLCSLLVLLAGGVAIAQQDVDRFESDNKATSVRPPVLEQTRPFNVPFTIKRSELDESSIIATDNLSALSRLENHDVMVLGRVESVFIPSEGNLIVLNFGSDHRSCFKAVIDPRNFHKFGTDDPHRIGRMYENRTIALDGLLSYYQRLPQIVVTLPHQLKIVSGR